MKITANADKNAFTVREQCSVTVLMTVDSDLKQNDTISFQYPHSWSLVSGPSFTRAFQNKDTTGEHFVDIRSSRAEFDIQITENDLFCDGRKSRHGRKITGVLRKGTIPAGQVIKLIYANTYAPYVAEKESLMIRVNNGEAQAAVDLFVAPESGKTLRILAPSGVEPGAEFHVAIVSLDRFENQSNSEFTDRELIRDDGASVAKGLNFKGGTRVPVSISKPGVYRFQMDDHVSNAVKVKKGIQGPYWGDIHIHTKLSMDAQGSDPFGYAREVSRLDFGAVTDHYESMSPRAYEVLEEWLETANRPGEFVSIPAEERNPKPATGHHNLYFRDMETFRKFQIRVNDPIKQDPEQERNVLERLPEDRAMLVPHHTGIAFRKIPEKGIGCAVDWTRWDDKGKRPVMEIYSHHGQSEYYAPHHILAYEFNRMRNPERRCNMSMHGPFYAQDYLKDGRRIGFLCSSDEHSGQGGRRHGGIAAVFTDTLTREGVFDAIRNRQCYGTTGERILMEFTVNGTTMGQSLTAANGDSIELDLNVWGTRDLLKVDILRYRFGKDKLFVPVLGVSVDHDTTDVHYQIQDEFKGNCVYYARVIQYPLEWPGMAWTSPVWVDEK